MQRNLELYKSQAEIKHNHAMEETVRKLKIEAEEMTKRALQENMRRIQMDTERMVAAAKKKSWCSNCTKEVRAMRTPSPQSGMFQPNALSILIG